MQESIVCTAISCVQIGVVKELKDDERLDSDNLEGVI